MQAQLQPTVLSAASDSHSATLNLQIPNDLRWFDGHFNHEPVLPGIALALWAKAAFQEHLAIQISAEVRRIKFRRVVSPGSTLQLQLNASKRLAFGYYAVDGSLVCSGEFAAEPGHV